MADPCPTKDRLPTVRWRHCIDDADTKQKPLMKPDCLLGVVPQPTDSRSSETTRNPHKRPFTAVRPFLASCRTSEKTPTSAGSSRSTTRPSGTRSTVTTRARSTWSGAYRSRTCPAATSLTTCASAGQCWTKVFRSTQRQLSWG